MFILMEKFNRWGQSIPFITSYPSRIRDYCSFPNVILMKNSKDKTHKESFDVGEMFQFSST